MQSEKWNEINWKRKAEKWRANLFVVFSFEFVDLDNCLLSVQRMQLEEQGKEKQRRREKVNLLSRSISHREKDQQGNRKCEKACVEARNRKIESSVSKACLNGILRRVL